MKELLQALAEELVDDPDGVEVRERERDGVVELELFVSRDDRGRVIGQRGRTADALRDVLEAVAARRGQSVTLEIR
ncbi:MAG TPA: KH domain-containing protein [Vicinamibacteria bacterium]